jgi:cell cycle checkpoint protein
VSFSPAYFITSPLTHNRLEQVTQRESYLSIFHAVGKVVYNKRYGDDVNDPYQPPLPEPPLPHQRYHRRASVSPPHKILAELTTEIPTFIAALHQNYVLSCSAGEEINNCIDALSDADLLLPQDQWDEAAIRQEEMAFEYAVRGLHLGLPSPVRRAPHDVKLFYPSSCKLWRKTEENEGIISMVCNKLRKEDPVSLSSMFGHLVLTTQTVPYALKVLESRKFRSQARLSAQQEILVQAMRKYSRFGQVIQPSEDPDEAPTGTEEEDGTAHRDLNRALAGANLDVYSTEFGKADGELSEDEIVDSD